MSTQYTVFWCFFHVFCLYQARRGASRPMLFGSLCYLFTRSTDVMNTVCFLLNFCPPGINTEFMMECKNWLHIRCDKCTRRNRSELIHCPVMKDQWDWVLNDLEELGDKECLVLMDQYNIEIFSFFLRLLPLYSSTVHQTNVERKNIVPKMILLISRIQPFHRLLEVDDHDEEEYSIVLTLGKRLANNLLAQYQSTFFHRWVEFL